MAPPTAQLRSIAVALLVLLLVPLSCNAFQQYHTPRTLSRSVLSVRPTHAEAKTSVHVSCVPPSSRCIRTTSAAALFASASSSTSSSSSESGGGSRNKPDKLIETTAYTLRRTSWFSWWTQVILTTISSIILLFARSVGLAAIEASSPGGAARNQASASFFIGGVGIAISFASIFWTWGGARLSARLLRGKTSRIQSANLLRRAITVASALNLSGMLVTLVGTFVIIGSLATKVLTAGGISPFGAVAAGGGSVALQTVQPLDILIVQANANTLLSHFVSLFLSLFLTRYVKQLDPPSTED